MRFLLVVALVLPLLMGSESSPRPRPPELKRYHLKIHVPDQSGIYFTAWADGDVVTDKDASDGKRVVYHRFLIWHDECVWEATETLIPITRDRYGYEYREAARSCPDGKQPNATTTPRDGHVTVHPANDNRPLTPLSAWTRGWDTRP